jgi:molecular chaperone HtpG
MSAQAEPQTLQFEAEVSRLLHLMVHSLYSNKEIFLRELISNAADACDKLRFEALASEDLLEGDGDYRIELEIDRDAGTLTVRDNGIGMSRDEVIANIGTIAKSGTREFVESLTGDQARDAGLIGQFGVGFYSAFIVADRVSLRTRKAGLEPEQGVHWSSDGLGAYTLEAESRPTRGTEVTLHLKPEEGEFLDAWRLRSIVGRYSDHIPLPVRMRSEEEGKAGEWETVNKASALWTRPKSEISDEEYQEFYKHVAHDFGEALCWVHNRVEGKLEYTSLLYLPRRPPFDLFDREQPHGVKLYVQRVFIMDDAEQLLPRYLRFVRGLVDSNDLPLNVSREILQENRVIDSIRAAATKRILSRLGELAEKEPEQYAEFWAAFGRVLKEGPGEDAENREQIAGLLRFASTRNEDDTQNVSLSDYVQAMREGQDAIYYLSAESAAAARHSPHLEALRKHGVEVLLLSDRVDEWLVAHLPEFDGKPLVSAARGDLDLKGLGDVDDESGEDAEDTAQAEALVERVQQALGERVDSVRVSKRLTESPACLVLGEQEMALYMQQLLREAGHELPGSRPVLEINPAHPLLARMQAESDESAFAQWALLLFEQALLAEGGRLEDGPGFVARVNRLLLGG